MGSAAEEASVPDRPCDTELASDPVEPPAAINVLSETENPKDKFGKLKPGFRCIPPIALIEEGIIMGDGGEKYGPFNWQDKPIRASVYYDAMFRHLLQWYTGEDRDPESRAGGLHLAAVRASAGILIDAFATGRVIDDRPLKTACASEAIKSLTGSRN